MDGKMEGESRRAEIAEGRDVGSGAKKLGEKRTYVISREVGGKLLGRVLVGYHRRVGGVEIQGWRSNLLAR